MKKFLCAVLIPVIVLSVSPLCTAYEPEEKVISDSALIMSTDVDTVLYEKNADVKTSATTLTKIMTAVIALENTKNPNSFQITASYESVHTNDEEWVTNYGIQENEVYTALDLIYMMMYTSANDAANVIASNIGGSIEKFVALMNAKAKKLGMKNTKYVNPTGLDEDGAYSTARDIALLTKHAMTLPVFQTMAKGVSYTVSKNSTHDAKTIYNDCELIPSDYENIYAYDYAVGVKSGATEESGYCVSAAASKDGSNYIAVVLGGKKTSIDGMQYTSALVDARRLFRWAFDNFKIKVVAEDTSIIDEVPVRLSSKSDYVSLVPSENVAGLVLKNVDASTVIIEAVDKPESLEAPIKKGDFVCKANVIHAGEVIMTIDLVAYDDVPLSVPKYIFNFIKKLLINPFALVFLLIVVAAGIAYIVIQADRRKKRKRERDRAIRQQINAGNHRQ